MGITFSQNKRLASFLLACLLAPVGTELAAQSYADFPDLELQPRLISPDADMPERLEQPAPASQQDQGLEGTIAEQEAAIEALSADRHAFDASTLDHLRSLGFLYQQAGRHEDAIEVLNQAHQLTRIHNGLYSPEQAALIDALINSHRALKDYDAADDMEAALYYVAQKSSAPGSDTLIQAQQRWADWNLEYFLGHHLYRFDPAPDWELDNRSLLRRSSTDRIRALPPYSITGPVDPFIRARLSDQSALRSGRFLSNESERLNEAEAVYEDLLENESDPARQAAYENKLIAISYYRKLEADIMAQRLLIDAYDRVSYQDVEYIARESYRTGKSLLTERVAAAADQPLSEEHLNARLNLADWYLLFDYTGQARGIYQDIITDLHEAGWDDEMITQFMNPEPALMIPTFIQHQYMPSDLFARDILISDTAANHTAGYLDLELRINRDGSVRSSNILAYSDDSSIRLRRSLRDYIRSKRYRPAFIDGDSTEQDLQLRYYYDYSETP